MLKLGVGGVACPLETASGCARQRPPGVNDPHSSTTPSPNTSPYPQVLALSVALAATVASAHDISTRASIGMSRALRRLAAAAEADSEAGEAALAMAEADGKLILSGKVDGKAAIFLGGEADTASGEASIYLGQAFGAAVYKVGEADAAGEAALKP